MFFGAIKKMTHSMSFSKKMAEIISTNTQKKINAQNLYFADKIMVEEDARKQKRASLETSLDGFQKQIKKEMAQALRGAEFKTDYLFTKVKKMYEEHRRSPLTKEKMKEYDYLMKHCQQARWEYMVHRSCCGFNIENEEIVMQKFPLAQYAI